MYIIHLPIGAYNINGSVYSSVSVEHDNNENNSFRWERVLTILDVQSDIFRLHDNM